MTPELVCPSIKVHFVSGLERGCNFHPPDQKIIIDTAVQSDSNQNWDLETMTASLSKKEWTMI